MEIVRNPYLEQLRAEVSELKRLVDGEPNDVAINHAWTAFARIKEALAQLSPNHPAILSHYR